MIFIKGADTEQDVLEIRTAVISSLKSGGNQLVESWSSENVSVKKVTGIPLKELLQECNTFLQTINPQVYGHRIRRTTPRFL